MVYYDTPGVLYDVASFFVFFYNEEFILYKRKIQYDEEENQYLKYCYQVKYNFQPSGMNQPLAYLDDKRSSLITSIIYEQTFEMMNLNDLLDYIVSVDFKKRLYQYWFETEAIININKFDYIKAVELLTVPEIVKYRIIIFLNDYERHIKEFVNDFVKLYDFIINFREENRVLIEQSKKKLNHEIYFKKVLFTYNADITNYNYSIVLINSIHLYHDDIKKSAWLGVDNYDVINYVHYGNLESFAYIYGEGTRVKIVKIVKEYQPICTSDIVEKVNLKYSAVQHHLTLLTEEGILITRKKNNRKLFYRINIEYFRQLNLIFQNTLNEYEKISINGDDDDEGMD